MTTIEKNPFTVVGSFFKSRRESRGISQLEIAKSLGYSSAQIVSNWERGTCNPPLEKVYLLVKILKIEPSEVVDIFALQTKIILKEYLSPQKSFQKTKPKRNQS